MNNPLNFGETNVHSTNIKFIENPCIGDGLNRLAHLPTAYSTTLTPMMTATYKLSRYGRMDDPWTYFNGPHLTHIHLRAQIKFDRARNKTL